MNRLGPIAKKNRDIVEEHLNEEMVFSQWNPRIGVVHFQFRSDIKRVDRKMTQEFLAAFNEDSLLAWIAGVRKDLNSARRRSNL